MALPQDSCGLRWERLLAAMNFAPRWRSHAEPFRED